MVGSPPPPSGVTLSLHLCDCSRADPKLLGAEFARDPQTRPALPGTIALGLATSAWEHGSLPWPLWSPEWKLLGLMTSDRVEFCPKCLFCLETSFSLFFNPFLGVPHGEGSLLAALLPSGRLELDPEMAQVKPGGPFGMPSSISPSPLLPVTPSPCLPRPPEGRCRPRLPPSAVSGFFPPFPFSINKVLGHQTLQTKVEK